MAETKDKDTVTATRANREIVEVDADTITDLPFQHQLGQTVVGGVAAFFADKAARKAYERVLWAWKVRQATK